MTTERRQLWQMWLCLGLLAGLLAGAAVLSGCGTIRGIGSDLVAGSDGMRAAMAQKD